MVWTKGYTIVTPSIVETPDGHKFLIEQIIEIPDTNPRTILICKIFSWLGDVLTAGRRRSWFFESIYSKTHFGWIGYNLVKDLLLDGKHTVKRREQYRMSWDRRSARIMVSEF
jgi:hypothetical protein